MSHKESKQIEISSLEFNKKDSSLLNNQIGSIQKGASSNVISLNSKIQQKDRIEKQKIYNEISSFAKHLK